MLHSSFADFDIEIIRVNVNVNRRRQFLSHSFSSTRLPTVYSFLQPQTRNEMASFIARRAFTTSARRFASANEEALKQESKRNPELYVRPALGPCRNQWR
jgi:hypothetical protein